MKTMEVKSVLNKIRNKKENKNGIYNIRLIEGEEGILSNEKGNIILIVVFGQGSITIDSKVINLFSGNIILLKQVGEIKYNIKDKNEICFVKLKKEFITTQLIAQMADCPILYDFLRLDTSQMEYLLFDITMQEVVKTY